MAPKPASADRGRRLCRRHRHGHGRFSGLRSRRSAPRLTEDQLAPALENGRRADALFRRRWRRRARRLPRRRSGDAALEARQEPEIRVAAVGSGPGRSVALGRPRRRHRCHRRRQAVGRHAVGARNRRATRFDTPERRAALEARINEVTAAIADEAVRKYYRQDFNDRLRQFFAPAQSQGFGQGFGRGAVPSCRASAAVDAAIGSPMAAANGSRWRPPAPRVGSRNTPYVVVSQQMAAARCIAATAPRCRPARR